jgi:hypothetical protein
VQLTFNIAGEELVVQACYASSFIRQLGQKDFVLFTLILARKQRRSAMGKMIITRKKLLVVAGSSLLALTACGGGGGKETGDAAGTGGDNKPAVKAEPVTIVLSRTPNYKMDPIENAINTTLAKKYPHITLEWRTEEGGNNMEGQVTAGQPPDVTLGASSSVNTLKQLGLAFDLTPLITKHKFDLSQYESRMLEMMRLKAEDGPFSLTSIGLVWNHYTCISFLRKTFVQSCVKTAPPYLYCTIGSR